MKIGFTSSNFHGNINPMIKRRSHITAIKKLLAHNPVVALLGARQVGKTTLAKTMLKNKNRPIHFLTWSLVPI